MNYHLCRKCVRGEKKFKTFRSLCSPTEVTVRFNWSGVLRMRNCEQGPENGEYLYTLVLELFCTVCMIEMFRQSILAIEITSIFLPFSRPHSSRICRPFGPPWTLRFASRTSRAKLSRDTISPKSNGGKMLRLDVKFTHGMLAFHLATGAVRSFFWPRSLSAETKRRRSRLRHR